MAPVTRRAAKAQGTSSTEESTTITQNTTSASKKETLFEEPIVLRSKRNTSSDGNGDGKKTTDESVETATPKSKKSDVRIRDDATNIKSPIEVHIPSSAFKTPRSRFSPVPDSQSSDASDEANQTFEPLSASKQLEEEATQKLASQARLIESGLELTPLAKAAQSARTVSSEKGSEELAPQPTKDEVESEAEHEVTPRPKAAKSKHVVFGDDDDVDKFVAAAAEKQKDVPAANAGDDDSDNQEESDDEAPEAVSTAAAARETLKSARAAIEAAEKYAASTKRKRQARDTLLKQQAKKRKRTEPSKQEQADLSKDDDKEEEDEGRNTKSKRQRRTQTLPDTLPAELLTDSSEDEEDETALKKMVKRPQKINFETAMQVLGAEGKGPRDEVVGSTRYRVLAEQGDQRLAPKLNRSTYRAKEALLRRGRTRVTVNKRKGFFVK
ncbi:hypothetical protein ONZ43_g7453 [Nemania bipapillata]|uniref:Uncharacterized protein n=1 Tax=Nemania bipapillata TaxID=110536 RepID=A0ACC2HQN9_9PEZI|nr:hypothetical protein ONZ43_g7453 [Nemania bipapillata]